MTAEKQLRKSLTEQLTKEAEAKGLVRCPVCGFNSPIEADSSHVCTDNMVPKDMVQEIMKVTLRNLTI